jgi:PhzF family phenazine biosynthesis protein
MKLPLYQVDAFAGEVFRGNPAAVCPLSRWLDAALMQRIACENNLSETAFIVGHAGDYEIRWFTPTVEIDLCGHATLASAHVVFRHLEPGLRAVEFRSHSGELYVRQLGELLAMEFPSLPPERVVQPPEALADALGRPPREVWKAKKWMALYGDEEDVVTLTPDFRKLKAFEQGAGVIVTARGRSSDFVSRFFAPGSGVDEDPVTGSAHCTLVPYWAAHLGKKQMFARQVSSRGGELWCEDRDTKVMMSGRAIEYLHGEITV